MALDQTIQLRLKDKLQKLNALRPLPVSALQKLREKFAVEMTYHSNAIEGNSLTLRETYLVIHEGVTIKGKPLKDHLEATNHEEALQYLYELVEHKRKNTISEHLIKNLHHLVTNQIEKEWAGKYRNAKVIIGGAKHQPPDALAVPNRMRGLLKWMEKHQKKLHRVEFAALLHHQFVHIHPFFDGNGRTGRLLMNVILMQIGYPLTIILKNDRKKYYRVLAQADEGNTDPLVLFIALCVDRSLSMYLDILTPSSSTSEKYLSLLEVSKMTPYSEKYLNLLARKGSLEAHKEGRNWVTTLKAVQHYVQHRKRKR